MPMQRPFWDEPERDKPDPLGVKFVCHRGTGFLIGEVYRGTERITSEGLPPVRISPTLNGQRIVCGETEWRVPLASGNASVLRGEVTILHVHGMAWRQVTILGEEYTLERDGVGPKLVSKSGEVIASYVPEWRDSLKHIVGYVYLRSPDRFGDEVPGVVAWLALFVDRAEYTG